MLVVILLIALSITDLVVMLSTTAVTIYNVQIVSVSLKIATFVSELSKYLKFNNPNLENSIVPSTMPSILSQS